METANDNVNHPKHYESLFVSKPLECIHISRTLPFSLGNAVKYIWRAGNKDHDKLREDLEKALWYLEDFHMHPQSVDYGRAEAVWSACLGDFPKDDVNKLKCMILQEIVTGYNETAITRLVGWLENLK